MLIEFPYDSNKQFKKSNSSHIQQRVNLAALASELSGFTNPIEGETKPEEVVGSQRGEVDRQQKKSALNVTVFGRFWK